MTGNRENREEELMGTATFRFIPGTLEKGAGGSRVSIYSADPYGPCDSSN